MGYDYELFNYYTVKKQKKYPWPCEPQPDRMIEVWPEDVLTRTGPNVYDMQTGIYKIGLQIPDEDTTLHDKSAYLRLI